MQVLTDSPDNDVRLTLTLKLSILLQIKRIDSVILTAH